MKKKLVIVCFSAMMLTISYSCANRKISRIDPHTQTDLSGRWNDSDSRLVAEEMIKDALTNNWIRNYVTNKDKKPTVIVGVVKNKTSEHIDATAFLMNLERSFINSGSVSVVQSAEARGALRDERGDQQQFASEETKKQWGKEKGADYMIDGVITSITDQYKNERTVQYQVNLAITDLESNEKVWIGEKQIKKFIKN